MNEIDGLNQKAEDLLSDFKSLDIVKRYQSVATSLKEDERLQKLKHDREKLQASIKYLKNEKKDEALKACKEMQIEYDNDPLVINYLSLKEEILELIKPLTETKL